MKLKNEVKYFCVKKTQNKLETFGQDRCFLGYKLDCQTRGKDEGVWAKWDWDGQRVVVENDHLGFYPLYYYADKDTFIISNYIVKLIAEDVDATFDEDAISVFIRCGIYLDQNTPFKSIKALPPDCRITWQDGKLDIASNKIIKKAEVFDTQTAVDGYVDYFRKAIEKYLPIKEEFSMPLSGGRDSRQILFELIKAGYKPKECMTGGEGRDMILAKQICERFDISNHKVFEADRYWLADTKLKNIATSFCAIEHGWLTPIGRYVSENYGLSFDGAGIGGFARNFLLTMVGNSHNIYRRGGYDELTSSLYDVIGPGEELISLLPDKYNFVSKNNDKSVQIFSDCLKSYSDAASPISSFNFYNWCRRSTSLSPCCLQAGTKVLMPFLDIDLFEFVSSIEGNVFLKDEPQTLAIKKAFPEYADIPFYEELPLSPAKPFRISVKVKNLTGIASFLASKSMLALKSYIKIKSSNLTLRQKNKMVDNLVYLVQLEHYSKKQNAEKLI